MLTRTTTALLEDLQDPANDEAWSAFDDRYRPVLVGFARQLGLGAEDAADAAQETLVRFIRAYRRGTYRRERGRLSSWIITIARNCVVDCHRAAAVRRERRGASAAAELPAPDRLTALWEAEREREVLRRALVVLREETRLGDAALRAFRLLLMHRLDAAQVAAELGMSLNDVYLAKHRCLKRMRSIVRELDGAWDDGPEIPA